MYQNPLQKSENSPFLQVMFLFLFAFGGFIVFAVIGVAIAFFIDGFEGIKGMAANDSRYISSFRILLVAQQKLPPWQAPI